MCGKNVFLTIDNLLIPCKIWDERKCSLDCEKSLPSHREVKVLSQTLNCTSEVLSIPPETEGPGGRAEPAVPVNKYFPIFLSSVCLSVSLLSLSPTKVSGGGGSFDYLCCRLIAFLNLCTDVLLHRPRACRTRPDGPLPGEKQTAPCFFLPTFSQLLTFILSFCLGCYRRHYQAYLLCLFS